MIYMQIIPNLALHFSSCLQTKSFSCAHTWTQPFFANTSHLLWVTFSLNLTQSWISGYHLWYYLSSQAPHIQPIVKSISWPFFISPFLIITAWDQATFSSCLTCLQIPHLAASIAVMITLWAKHVLDFPECSWAGFCLLISLISTSYPLLHPIQTSFSALTCIMLLSLEPLHMLVSLPGTLLTFCMWISSTQLQISIQVPLYQEPFPLLSSQPHYQN